MRFRRRPEQEPEHRVLVLCAAYTVFYLGIARLIRGRLAAGFRASWAARALVLSVLAFDCFAPVLLLVLVQRGRLPARQLSVLAMGDNHPLASNATPAGKAKNRKAIRERRYSAHSAQSSFACSKTVCVAFSCLSGG